MTRSASSQLRFGTDGWRGLIAEDFTLANVRRVARAIARYFVEAEDVRVGVIVGYDGRFLSATAAHAVAEELSAAGLPVRLSTGIVPTPAVSYAVRHWAAAGAVMVTASHNPPRWNGLKLKARYAGSAPPRVVAEVERYLADNRRAPALPPQPRLIEPTDLKTPYLNCLRQLIDLAAIARSGVRLLLDPMHGAAAGWLRELLTEHGLACDEIHARPDPLFGGLHPEPIPPHLDALARAVRQQGYDAGLATDGDADRVGAIDAGGSFVDPHRIFALVLDSLLARGERGAIARTFSATGMVDRIAARFGLPVHVTPIGFKYICELMLERNLLIGGEESGGIGLRWHLPERDALLVSLLVAEILARQGQPLAELVGRLHCEYGPHHFARLDLPLPLDRQRRLMAALARRPPARIGSWKVTGREDLDGLKFHLLDAGWVLVRPSGTEPLLRLYAETPDAELTRQVLAATRSLLPR